MLNEPASSPYDLSFSFLGFPVRVAWGFWVVAAILGWSWSQSVDAAAVLFQIDSPGPAVLLVVWIGCVFVSILIHELGHALAMRYYGLHSRIVLYHFGGLAISDSFGSWNGARSGRVEPREQIVISLAGPVAQLLLALSVWILGISLGVYMDETRLVNRLLGTHLGATELPSSIAIYAVFSGLLMPSFYWAILNLAPILPLDGGQILHNALYVARNDRPTYTAHLVSVVTGAAIGLWSLSSNQFGGFMFLALAASNWQAMQYGGRGF